MMNETKYFFERITDIFSGFMCAFCTPKSRNFFKFSEGSFTIRMERTACSSMMYQFQYSLLMIDIFNKIIFPLMEFIKCTQDAMEDPDYALFLVDDYRVSKKKNDIELCRDDANWEDKYCVNLCEIKFGNFAIKMNFIGSFKQSLKSRCHIFV